MTTKKNKYNDNNNDNDNDNSKGDGQVKRETLKRLPFWWNVEICYFRVVGVEGP